MQLKIFGKKILFLLINPKVEAAITVKLEYYSSYQIILTFPSAILVERRRNDLFKSSGTEKQKAVVQVVVTWCRVSKLHRLHN